MKVRNDFFDLRGTLAHCACLTGRITDTLLAERGGATGADRAAICRMDAALLVFEAREGAVGSTPYYRVSMIDALRARATNLPVILEDRGYGTPEALLAEPALPQLNAMAVLTDIAHGDGDLSAFFDGPDAR